MQRLRAKLWDSGYKLSSKKIEAFLDYVADSAMSDTAAIEEDVDDVDDVDPVKGSLPKAAGGEDGTRGHPTTADARVDRLQQDIDALEYAIMKYVSKNTWPSVVTRRRDGHPHPRHGDGNDDQNDGENDNGNERLDAHTPSRPSTATFQKKKPLKKSDPVAMFHRMQSIWRSSSTSQRKKKQPPIPKATSK